MKGFGDNVVTAIIAEREKAGLFADLYDFIERTGAMVGRKPLETLVYSGALDSFGLKRSQYFLPGRSGDLFIDELVRYSTLFRNDMMDSSSSLFGDVEELKPVRPEPPMMPESLDDTLEILQKEKEYVGMYLSAHPLDRYRFEIEKFAVPLTKLDEIVDECGRAGKSMKVNVAGIVTDVKNMTTKSGSPGAKAAIEDFSGNYEFALFGKDYQSFYPMLKPHEQVFIEGEVGPRYRLSPEEAASGKKAPFVFRMRSVSLLGLVGESLIKSVEFTLDTSLLNAGFRKDLISMLKEYKGNTRLEIRLLDKSSGYKINFFSKKFSVRACQDLFDEAERLGMRVDVIDK